MDPMMFLQIIFLSAISAFIYMFVGIIPGTDETATIAPITLALLLMGFDPLVVLAWFMACIVAFKMADSIPVALAGIPGGVMAVPQVPDAIIAKKEGLADVVLRKGLSASVIGSIVAVIVSLTISFVMMPLGTFLGTKDVILGTAIPRWFWILFAGLILLAVMSKNKFVALLSIPMFALVIQGLRAVYGKSVFISFFLGITIGPLIYELFSMFNGEYLANKVRRGYMKVRLTKVREIKANPLVHLSALEKIHATIWAAVTSILAFVMSPVGLTILIGDTLRDTQRDRVKGALLAYSVRDAIKNATYIGGTLIPLLVLKKATGPMSAGPALPFFEGVKINGVNAATYIVNAYSYPLIAGVIFLAVIIGILVSYPLLVKYSRAITVFVFKRIPAEALYGLFIAIVLLLAYNDMGIMGIFGAIIVAVLSGALWRMGVSLGVLFMTLVGAPYIVSLLF